jgi:Protein of unknown function (DUF2934)
MAKTRGAAGAAMTEAPREGDARPRQGDPLEEQVVDEQLAAAQSVTAVSAADRGAADQVAIEPAAQPIVSEGSPSMHTATAWSDRPGVNDVSAATDEAIARRAYELYQARGGTHGADVDDWLQAERELRGERQQYADRGPSEEPDNSAHRPID